MKENDTLCGLFVTIYYAVVGMWLEESLFWLSPAQNHVLGFFDVVEVLVNEHKNLTAVHGDQVTTGTFPSCPWRSHFFNSMQTVVLKPNEEVQNCFMLEWRYVLTCRASPKAFFCFRTHKPSWERFVEDDFTQ